MRLEGSKTALFWSLLQKKSPRAFMRSPTVGKMEKKKKKKRKKNLKMFEARHCHREWWLLGFKRAFDNYA